MRTIRFTARFHKDYKRVQKGLPTLQAEFKLIADMLVADLPLPPKNRDHSLRRMAGFSRLPHSPRPGADLPEV